MGMNYCCSACKIIFVDNDEMFVDVIFNCYIDGIIRMVEYNSKLKCDLGLFQECFIMIY